MPGVSDSSPLLYLALLGDLNLLPSLFGNISIPQAVWQELVIDGCGRPGASEAEKAYDTFFHASWSRLRGQAYVLTGSHEQAQDLTQEAFIKAQQENEALFKSS